MWWEVDLAKDTKKRDAGPGAERLDTVEGKSGSRPSVQLAWHR
jgi:hypothetical protein